MLRNKNEFCFRALNIDEVNKQEDKIEGIINNIKNYI